MQEECILGIKIQKMSYKIERLSIYSGQSNYDYLCEISLDDYCNDNGSYKINFYNKKHISGCSIGGWRIQLGYINFNWGCSECRFDMMDKEGFSISDILCCEQDGSKSSYGFNIEKHARTIFPKAIEIITKFPSAEIYDLYCELSDLISTEYSFFQVLNSKKRLKRTEYLNEICKSQYPPLEKIIENYMNLDDILKNKKDQKSKILRDEIKGLLYNFLKKNFSK